MIGATSAPAGIIHNEPEGVYRSSGCVGNSILSDFLADEMYCYRKHVLKVIHEDPSKDMKLGSALHSYMEGYQVYRKRYCIKTSGIDLRTADGKEWARSNAGKDIIDRKDHIRVSKMAAAIRRNPSTRDLYAGSKREVTVRLHQTPWGVPVQVRIDAWGSCLVDWKKTQDAEEWPRKLVAYGYHRQAALYSWIVSLALMEPAPPFVFVAVDDNEPYRVRLYTLSEAWMERAKEEVNDGMTRLAHAIRNNDWKYHNKGVQVLEPKPWQRISA
ncbi:MAG: PD-(D/E)XK nuclease-like domain-containing protein [Gemmatimonadaceae bacterium]|nr:PD-(D/E)XK nuclease-like domain-containing protein [Gemmatimonadaceae bacterium]